MLKQHGVIHLPGQNEELAATTLMGTQMIDEHPHPDVDGVVAYWYGKGPGLDRAGDALKHGNFAGTSTHGAVVILSGEDHEAKSSTVPYQQEFAFEHHGIPVLYPSSVSEFIEFGLHAAAMSRYSGCWVALKLVAPLCDGGEVVQFSPDQHRVRIPDLDIDGKPFAKVANFTFFPGLNIETERQLYIERHAAVQAYARENRLNRISIQSDHDSIGIVSAGKTYSDTRQALRDMGFGDEELRGAGIRLAKIGLLCPLDMGFIREFATGLSTVIVIEEKRDFLERQIGHALCSVGSPKLVGKYDVHGKNLFPVEGGLNSDLIATLLGRALEAIRPLPTLGNLRLAELREIAARNYGVQPRRTLNYCSGCPHNVSTKLAPGQIAWGAPGCHIFAAVMDTPDKRIEAVTQLGGEGLPWIGLSPFTTRKHIVQNIGDGSLMHSSYQNIRFAVTAGVNITFKILFNGVIANTGGQTSIGAPSLVNLISHLALEGLAKIVLIAKEPQRYKGITLPSIVSLRPSDRLEASMMELAGVVGTTVLIYDGECANERRRRQKRGKAPAPTRFTVVNEDVCENCGDCGRKANCMSLQKVDTEFGAKTQIHQSSCNQDQACINGECPSFVTVEVPAGTNIRKPTPPAFDDVFLPNPVLPSLSRPYSIYIPGLGGTGVITANAILAQAAFLDGNEAKSYDQTGAAQKWGAVLSSLIVSTGANPPLTNRVGLGKANLYLALDLLAAVDKHNLDCCSSSHTRAVINAGLLPSGEMIRNPHLAMPGANMISTIRAATDSGHTVVVDARKIAEGLFGDYMMANMVMIGAAYQAGLLPITAESIEDAIRLNGTQAQANILAFRAGRLAHHAPAEISKRMIAPFRALADRTVERKARYPRGDVRVNELVSSLLPAELALDSNLTSLIHTRTADLIDYQNVAYAKRYLKIIADVAGAEKSALGLGSGLSVTDAVARNLHKLMAYKDEYEVARLLLMSTFSKRVQEMFTGSVRMVFNLQPPFLRWFGLNGKVGMGPWIRPLLKILSAMKFVRGTAFDPFGYLQVRRQEQELIRWYNGLIQTAMGRLTLGNQSIVLELLSLPEQIRGYESVKAKAIKETKEKAADLVVQLGGGGTNRQIRSLKRNSIA
ncbi:indolepyruvate ferredoxin oxidoreductase [Eoetvoesiella caeni]|uniref:Indolepyruvate ferredoxin oxidoreductase n=2 Tax=Eoetvoesiella caeni TaxID=645616 RepID=A0A366H1R6_9BURK|nr:indolepyruvate ferredoxin oxidoreductase [Eoetvoesiella caeni]